MTPLQETLRFLDDAVSSGKIAYYSTRTGLSPAGDDELTNEDPLHQDPSVLLGARKREAKRRSGLGLATMARDGQRGASLQAQPYALTPPILWP